MPNNFFVDAKQRLLAKKSNSIWEKSPKGGMRLRCVRLFPTKFKKCIQLTKSCKLIEKFLFSTPFASRLLRSDTKHKLINVGLISNFFLSVECGSIDFKEWQKSTFNRKLNFAHQYFRLQFFEKNHWEKLLQIFLFIFTDHLLLLGNLDCEKFTEVWEWRQMHKLSWTDLTLKPIWVPQFFWKDEEKDQVMMRWFLTLSKALESFS